jgi:hypothetical protein
MTSDERRRVTAGLASPSEVQPSELRARPPERGA